MKADTKAIQAIGNQVLSDIKIKGEFVVFFLFYVRYSTLLICRPSDSTVSEDAGIEARTAWH